MRWYEGAEQGAFGLGIRSDIGQFSLKSLYASRRAPVNLIDAALLAVTNWAKGLASLAFSAASKNYPPNLLSGISDFQT